MSFADERARVPSTTTPPQGGGREELRAAVLKPYLLRMRAEKGEHAMRHVLGLAGIPASVVNDETAWISVAAACRALHGLFDELGPGTISHPGAWQTHPENLGTYVPLLRAASVPVDAYRFFATHAEQSTRVGTYDLVVIAPDAVRITYRPKQGEEVDQSDPLLCQAREGELSGMPQIWGLPEAHVVHGACLARGDDRCSYEITWSDAGTSVPTPLLAAASGAVLALMAGLFGGWIAPAIGAVVGFALGWLVGRWTSRRRQERAERALDRHRILALERGLELRGEAANQAPPGDLRGTLLGGKYRITDKIGSGGIGVVYAAEHVALGSRVAVKVLRGAAAKDAGEVARLRREAQVQVTLEHPNVVRTLDLDRMSDGSIYVVMELLRGRSLAETLSHDGPLAPGRAVPVFVQACRALKAAHDKGVVHRDLKPGNIFLCDDGVVKVLDFGMSKFASAESLTQTGYTLGTPEYMAPEQCIGGPVEARTDLYAFGVLMYEALTGELPIVAHNRRQLLELHQHQQPKTMRQRRPELDIPQALDDVVMSTLRKRPEDRPNDAGDLERKLLAIPMNTLAEVYPPSSSRTRALAQGPLTRSSR